MDSFDFFDLEEGKMKVENYAVQVNSKEMKNCTFCDLPVLKADMLKHTQTHINDWRGEDLIVDDDQEQAKESLDEITEEMDTEVPPKEVVEDVNIRCSFCPRVLGKDDIRDHLSEHVAQWEGNSSVSNKNTSSDKKDVCEEQSDFVFEERSEEKSLAEKISEDVKTKDVEIRKLVNCSFCNELVEKDQIQDHTEKHVASWGDSSEQNIAGEQKHSIGDESKTIHNQGNSKDEDEILDKRTESIKCSFCPEYIEKVDLVTHIQNHSLKWGDDLLDTNSEIDMVESQKNKCKFCGKCLGFKQALIEHERIHTGEKPLQCLHCNQTFRDKFGLGRHVKTKHTKEISCDQCGKAFEHRQGLIRHMSKQHGSEVGVKCEECKEVFVSENSLETHRKGGCYRHVCTSCGKMFKQKCNLTSHMITHKEPDEAKVLVCDECGKKFSRQSMLDEHVRSHFNKKEFKCKICGKGFNRKSGLWCHNKYRCQVKLESN